MTFKSGNALTLDSLIIGENGYFEIRDAKVGDKIYGDDGKLYNITGVFPQGVTDVYKLKFRDGTVVKCSSDHLWNIRLYGEETYKTIPVYEFANKPITIFDEEKGDNYLNICTQINKPVSFDNKITPLEPYDYGASLLEDYDENTSISDEYKYTGIYDKVQMIKGIYDTYKNDLSCYIYENGSVKFVFKYKKISEDFNEIVCLLGGMAFYSEKTDRKTSLQVYTVIFNLPNNLYKDIFGLLETKYDFVEKEIIEIIKLNDEETQCIEVDNPSHLFLTNGCVVTHNTYKKELI